MDIHELIHSMTKGDKRHFSLSARRQGTQAKQYLKLYYMILNQKSYNEAILKKSVGKSSFAQLKHELLKHVMNSLGRKHLRTDHASTLLALGNAHVLVNKELWKDASKMISKVFDVNSPVESSLSYLGFSETAYIQSRVGTNHDLSNAINKWGKRKDEMIHVFEIESSYDQLYMKITLMNRKIESTRNIKIKKELNLYLNHSLLKTNPCPSSPYANLNFHYCNGLARYLLGEFDKSLFHMLQVKNQIDSNFSLRLKREDLYLRSIGNLVLCAIQTQKINTAQSYLLELRAYKSIYSSNIYYQSYLADLMELMICNQLKMYPKSLILINGTMSKAITTNPQLRLTQEYSYQIFQTITAFMNLGKFKEAKKIVLNFITENKSSSKKDAYNYARIIYLILLIEAKQDDLLENELRSIDQHLKKHKQLFLFESAFLHFVKRLLHPKPEVSIKEIYHELIDKLQSLKADHFEKNAFVYFEFDNWAANKIAEL